MYKLFIISHNIYKVLLTFMNKIISIGKAAQILGVHVQTLRNWEKSGKLK
ncbi:MAG: MerR family DNA-binding transcriptional regulator, partial [Succinivibrio sp.]|nr:MerR family DNA-binding transcriptional regulator [Succinivibrio sp.]